MEEEAVLSLSLVEVELDELDIFGIVCHRFRYANCALEAQSHLAAHVVAAAALVEALQVGTVARDTIVTQPMPVLAAPFPCFAFSVFRGDCLDSCPI